jgi:hypothetical protein
MTRLVLPIFALLILCPFYANGQDCKRETDKFKGIDKITCDNVQITVTEQPGERIARSGLFVAKTSESSAPLAVITTRSDSWNFLDTDTAYILADESRIEVSVKRAGSDAGNGHVVEQQALMFDLQQARQLSQADTVRMKMGSAVFRLDPLPARLSEVFRLADQ